MVAGVSWLEAGLRLQFTVSALNHKHLWNLLEYALAFNTSGKNSRCCHVSFCVTKPRKDAIQATGSLSFHAETSEWCCLPAACPHLPAPKVTWSARDEWTLFGDTLIRHHNVPRRSLFTPSCTTDCPVPAHCLGDMRETTVRAVGKSSVLKDAWSQVGHPHRDLGYLWTGQTKFNVKVDKQASAVPVPQDELAETSFQEGFEEYWGDVFPDHWSEAEKARPAKKYVDVPEEFYSKSKRRPVTPKNFNTWFSRARGKGLRWHFQEPYSGSGRLSLMSVLSGLMVGFPIDNR